MHESQTRSAASFHFMHRGHINTRAPSRAHSFIACMSSLCPCLCLCPCSCSCPCPCAPCMVVAGDTHTIHSRHSTLSANATTTTATTTGKHTQQAETYIYGHQCHEQHPHTSTHHMCDEQQPSRGHVHTDTTSCVASCSPFRSVPLCVVCCQLLLHDVHASLGFRLSRAPTWDGHTVTALHVLVQPNQAWQSIRQITDSTHAHTHTRTRTRGTTPHTSNTATGDDRAGSFACGSRRSLCLCLCLCLCVRFVLRACCAVPLPPCPCPCPCPCPSPSLSLSLFL